MCVVCVCMCQCVSRFVFFFQAEDGIRDLVRSRGLGDVYKRQVCFVWLYVSVCFSVCCVWLYVSVCVSVCCVWLYVSVCVSVCLSLIHI